MNETPIAAVNCLATVVAVLRPFVRNGGAFQRSAFALASLYALGGLCPAHDRRSINSMKRSSTASPEAKLRMPRVLLLAFYAVSTVSIVVMTAGVFLLIHGFIINGYEKTNTDQLLIPIALNFASLVLIAFYYLMRWKSKRA